MKLENDDFKRLASTRFPESFVKSAPENAQRLILWCLERDPQKRPTAEELLTSDLLPRKIELEQRYLEEALHLLTSHESDSYMQILNALFSRPNPGVVDLMFDTDTAAKANSVRSSESQKVLTPSEGMMNAISHIRSGSIDVAVLGKTLAMSASSLLAATSSLIRAHSAISKMGGKRSVEEIGPTSSWLSGHAGRDIRCNYWVVRVGPCYS